MLGVFFSLFALFIVHSSLCKEIELISGTYNCTWCLEQLANTLLIFHGLIHGMYMRNSHKIDPLLNKLYKNVLA